MGLPQEDMGWKPLLTERTLLPWCWVKQGLSYCLHHCDVYSGLGSFTSFWMMSFLCVPSHRRRAGTTDVHHCIWLFKSRGSLTQVARLVKQAPLPAKPSCWPLLCGLYINCVTESLFQLLLSPLFSVSERVPPPEVSLCHPRAYFKCNNVKIQFIFLRHWFKSKVTAILIAFKMPLMSLE